MSSRYEVVGHGMVAKAFASAAKPEPPAIICASGVSNSQCTDELAFQREQDLIRHLTRRASDREAVLVYFSGAPVYGRMSGMRTEICPAVPETPYGIHKASCERLIVESGVPHLVLRLPNVVGAFGHTNQLVPSLVAQAVAGSVQIRDGATRDLLDVDDLVAIVAALLDAGVSNLVLNVASGRSVSISELVEIVNSVLGLSPSVNIVEGGDAQEFSIDLVRRVLPNYPCFESDYAARVLHRRVPSIARAFREGVLG